MDSHGPPRHADPAHIRGTKEDHDSVLEFTQALVRIPSRAASTPMNPSSRSHRLDDRHGLIARRAA